MRLGPNEKLLASWARANIRVTALLGGRVLMRPYLLISGSLLGRSDDQGRPFGMSNRMFWR
jgi:hypothetical protein